MPKKQAVEELKNAITNALQEIGKDQTELLKILNKIVDKINSIENTVMELDNTHQDILEKLDKIQKMVYWHRKTTEQQQQGNYQGKQYKSYNKSYGRKQYRRYRK